MLGVVRRWLKAIWFAVRPWLPSTIGNALGKLAQRLNERMRDREDQALPRHEEIDLLLNSLLRELARTHAKIDLLEKSLPAPPSK
jgi:hypothetical protein